MPIEVPAVAVSDLLTVKEAAKYLRVSISSLRNYFRAGRIPFLRLLNRSVRFRRADLDAYLASCEVSAPEKAA
jgi:excisionase family DNA binding protein